MKLQLTFLGTAASTPTAEQNLSAVSLGFEGKQLLFDCPEGTQRQMMKAGLSFLKVDAIFLSHFHGDHFLGIPGLLATNAMHQRFDTLTIIGPKGIARKIEQAVRLANIGIPFPIEFVECKNGIVFDSEKFQVRAFPLKHKTECWGFLFEEKVPAGKFLRAKAEALKIPEGPLWGKLQEGKSVKFEGKIFKPEQVLDFEKGRKARKIAIVCDTLPIPSIAKAVEGCDVLVHEATFLDEMKERAKLTFHSTAKQAAEQAAKAGVEKLLLFHYSQRQLREDVEREAKKAFSNSHCVKELEKVDV
ncbi:MAG: ribonuclease Z [Candidatus Diapherotrites archaeon]